MVTTKPSRPFLINSGKTFGCWWNHIWIRLFNILSTLSGGWPWAQPQMLHNPKPTENAPSLNACIEWPHREGNGNPRQYSCLENSMDGGAWRATVRGVAKSLHTTELLTHTNTEWPQEWKSRGRGFVIQLSRNQNAFIYRHYS